VTQPPAPVVPAPTRRPPQPGSAGEATRDRLIAAHRAAARFFTDQLTSPAGRSPRAYLRSRGLGPLLETTRWELGYAPPTWDALSAHLRGCGFHPEELLTAGLAMRTRRGTLIDRFRDRVTLTVHDLTGDPVGFVARAAPRATAATPKYLNSPRTPLFDKSALLVGLAEQHDALAAGAVPVIVEGPFDALAVHLATDHAQEPLAAVSPCGTALTPTQAAALAECSGHAVVVAFDADPAGARAATTAYHLLAGHFSRLHATLLPEGTDPAKILQTAGPRALAETLQEDRPLADAVLDPALAYWRDRRDNAEARVAAVRELAPALAALRPDDVGRQVARAAQQLDVDHATLTQALADAVTTHPPPRSTWPSFCTTPAGRSAPQPRLGLG
jgi:DNA primase